jgi:hypothetical protein
LKIPELVHSLPAGPVWPEFQGKKGASIQPRWLSGTGICSKRSERRKFEAGKLSGAGV